MISVGYIDRNFINHLSIKKLDVIKYTRWAPIGFLLPKTKRSDKVFDLQILNSFFVFDIGNVCFINKNEGCL
jgi:hypothetical protein